MVVVASPVMVVLDLVLALLDEVGPVAGLEPFVPVHLGGHLY